MSSLISVVIPAYNQAPFLRQAIESVRMQSYHSLEVIAIDDGSTDETPLLLSQLQAEWPSLRVLRQPNRGLPAARNAGIKLAKGEWIAFLDSDDWWSPTKLEQLMSHINTCGADIAYGPVWIADEEGAILGCARTEEVDLFFFRLQLFFRNLIPTPSSILGRASCFQNNLFDETLTHSEDYELYLRLTAEYRFSCCVLPLTYYRRHGGNMSNKLSASRAVERQIVLRYPWSTLEKLLAQTPWSEVDKALFAGKLRYNREELKEALLLLSGLSNPWAAFYAGNAHFMLREWDSALFFYNRAVELSPEMAEGWNNLGCTLFYLERGKTESEAAFFRAAALRNDYLDPQKNLRLPGDTAVPAFTFKELRRSLLPYREEQ